MNDRPIFLAWKYLLGAFVLVILTIPSNLYKLPVKLPFGLEIYRLVGAFMLLFWVFALLIDPEERWRRTPFDGIVILILSVVYMSLLVNLSEFKTSEEFNAAIKAALFFTTYFLAFYMTVSTFTRRRDIDITLKFIVWLGGALGIFAVLERTSGYNIFRHLHEFMPILQETYLVGAQLQRGGLRVSGSVVHPIAFSALLAMIAPLAFYFWQTAKNRRMKIVYAIFMLLIISAVVLTGSRTGFLGLGGAFLILFLGNPERRVQMVSGLLIVFFLIHMVFPGALGTLRTFLSPSYIQKTEVGNEAGRYEDYPKIWTEFKQRPLLGRSFGTFEPDRFFFVDNQYLKFVVETGILGTLAFLYLLYAFLRFSWSSSKKPQTGQDRLLVTSILAASSVFVVASFTFDTFGFSQVPYLFFIVTGSGVAFILNRTEVSGAESLAS